MKKYKQLPLKGNSNDYKDSISELDGYNKLVKAMENFYTKNKEFNPRQLHYLISSESMDIHLGELIGLR